MAKDKIYTIRASHCIVLDYLHVIYVFIHKVHQ